MKVRLALCVSLIGVPLSACGQASASGFDPANPLHCAAQFENYSLWEKQDGREAEARGFAARSQWYAVRARSLPAEQRTMEALTELSKRIAADKDGGATLAKECLKRQDADPDFQRLVQKAKEALAAGRPTVSDDSGSQ